MTVPTPLVQLNGICSILHDNTLYVYSPDGFQSIVLEEGAEWKQLPSGLAVTGGVCVKGGLEGDNDETALYIVGGSTAVTVDYPGVQRYSFSNGTWENMTPVNLVTQNRQNHAAVYLNATSKILVYAGSQDGDANPSTQTFTISTISPYAVASFESNGAPPAVRPVLLQWNETDALMAGGNTDNTELYLFNPDAGWRNLGASLSSGMASVETVQSAILTGSDGSKILETFDMSTSPNTVTSVVLAGADGSIPSSAYTIGASTTTTRRSSIRKRDFTIDNYPTYNSSLAPDTTRTNFTLAQDGNGLVAIAGGSSDSGDSFCVFNSGSNTWLNATELMYGESTTSTSTTNGGSSTSTTSSSSAASTSAAATSSDPSESTQLKRVLGATLGTALGVIAILIGVLVFLRHYRKKREAALGHKKKESGEEKGRLSFQDQGLQPLKPAAMPMGRGPVPSTDSWAIMAARANGSAPPLTPNQETFGRSILRSRSPLGTAGTTPTLLGDGTVSPPGKKEEHFASGYEQNLSEKKPDRTTNEGWDKYFQSNGTTTDLVGLNSDRSTYASFETKSDYRSSAWPGYFEGADSKQKVFTPSAEIAPLKVANRFDGQEHFSQVSGGTPTTTRSSFKQFPVAGGMTAKISSGDSIDSDDDEDDDEDHRNRYDAFSSGVPTSINSENLLWDPTSDGGRSSVGRPPSSNYGGRESNYPQSSIYSPTARNIPSSIYPSSHPPSSIYPRSSAYPESEVPDIPSIPTFPLPSQTVQSQSHLQPQPQERPLTHWPNNDPRSHTIPEEASEASRASSIALGPERPLTLWPSNMDTDIRASQRGTSAIIREYYGRNQAELEASRAEAEAERRAGAHGGRNINSDMSWLNLGHQS